MAALEDPERGRIVEAVLSVAPPPRLRELFQEQLKGRLVGVACHRLANHGLQRLLDHAPSDLVGGASGGAGLKRAEVDHWWTYFGVLLVAPFGSLLGPIGGPIWVPLVAPFGFLLGPIWVSFGSYLDPFLGPIGGPIWVPLGSHWWLFWGPIGGPICVPFGSHWWPFLGSIGGSFGVPFVSLLGPIGGPVWVRFGSLWCPLTPFPPPAGGGGAGGIGPVPGAAPGPGSPRGGSGADGCLRAISRAPAGGAALPLPGRTRPLLKPRPL